MTRHFALVLAFGVALVAATAIARADCHVHQGDRVVLYSSTDDPSVLAWDSPFRLRDYHAASFDESQQLLAHASLLPPGTRATVQGCIADFVHSRFAEHPDDAVEITTVTNGKGHVWWVLSSDLRLIQKPSH